MGAMHDYVKPTRQAFHCFQIENCWGMKRANARLQLLHMTCVDNENREYNIDFVCQSHTNILAGEVAALPLVERCSIIAAKLFFKKMRLIEKQRLTSSAFAVAYLCYTKDHTILERSFARFMAYFANFDFREFRMTTNGPELKQTHDLAYEALDLYSNAATGLTYNTLGGTVPEAMDIAKEWMHFLASIPHIDRIIFVMKPTVILFNTVRKKFTKRSEGDPMITHFAWDTNTDALEQKDLLICVLRWDGHGMIWFLCLNFLIWTTFKYVGRLTKVISLEKDQKMTSPESLDDVFEFLKEIRLDSSPSTPASATSTQSFTGLSAESSSSGSLRVSLGSPLENTGTPKRKIQKSEPTKSDKIPKNKKKVGAIKEKTTRQLEVEEMYNVADRFCRFSNEMKNVPAPVPRRLKLEELVHDNTIRGINYGFVDNLVKVMSGNNMWHHDQTLFIVCKSASPGKFNVLDGNHRLEAYLKYNRSASQPYTHVRCIVYEILKYEQILLVTQPSNTVFKKLDLTELQMVRISLDLLEKRKLPIPKQDKKSRAAFNKLMKTAIGNDYLVIATEIIQKLPLYVITILEQQKFKNSTMSHSKFSSRFWRILFSAVRKDCEASLAVIATLETCNVEEVQKRLFKVDIHLITHLETVFHNSNRKAAAVDWKQVKKVIGEFIKTKAQCKNLNFLGDDVPDFSKYSFIVVFDPSPQVLQRLSSCETSVIILIAPFHETAPVLPCTNPTLLLNILVRDPPIVDFPTSTIPVVTVEASLYVPDAPDSSDEAKLTFLSELATEKKCRLSSTLLFEHLSMFADYAKETNYALVRGAKFAGKSDRE
uniref:Uncharacterized protein n=1 Tax=Panagrolaimus superbus TaxID=310955 RepID=A0A914YPD8_9BILA